MEHILKYFVLIYVVLIKSMAVGLHLSWCPGVDGHYKLEEEEEGGGVGGGMGQSPQMFFVLFASKNEKQISEKIVLIYGYFSAFYCCAFVHKLMWLFKNKHAYLWQLTSPLFLLL